MRVTLLGTGSADGWPNPFCGCASCETARAAGDVRAQTSALVDDALLLDCGPEAARQAERCGASLRHLSAVLVTHAHPDHLDPAFLLYRGWAGDAPLQVLGPREVLDVCEPWLPPGSAVTLTAVSPGDEVHVAGYRVRALAAAHESPGGALLYDVTAPDGDRLLYATDTGPPDTAPPDTAPPDTAPPDTAPPDTTPPDTTPPDTTPPDTTPPDTAPPDTTPPDTRPPGRPRGGRAYSVVLLEETFGDLTTHGTDHLDLATFPRVLAGLRATGAVDERTDVVAVHLSHHNPPIDELRRRLARYGARVARDGETLGTFTPRPTTPSTTTPNTTTPSTTTPLTTTPDAETTAAHMAQRAQPAPPRRTLVTGGARSGKSREAESMLLAEPEVVYVATGVDRTDDAAWRRRVARHRERRPQGWLTVETLDLVPLLTEPGPPLLVDCLTLWLAGMFERLDAWSEDADDERVEKGVMAEVEALARAWRQTPRRVVAVTNEVGSGVVPATVSGGRFRDLLGALNAAIAAESEQVLLCVAGRVVRL